MLSFSIPVQVRWSDMDPNFHIRHSVFYDWGAMSRILFFEKFGLTAALMQKLQLGPIIFREECVFRREIRMGDPVMITIELVNSKRDYSRWTIRHSIVKDTDTVAAILTIDGTWLDTIKRKLTLPPQEAVDVFTQMPHSENFQWID